MLKSKLPVVITSLAIRFNVDSGWTRELLEKYLVRGKILQRGFGPNESKWQYFILDVGSALDVDRMFDEGVIGEVCCKDEWHELRGLSDRDAMKRRNW